MIHSHVAYVGFVSSTYADANSGIRVRKPILFCFLDIEIIWQSRGNDDSRDATLFTYILFAVSKQVFHCHVPVDLNTRMVRSRCRPTASVCVSRTFSVILVM